MNLIESSKSLAEVAKSNKNSKIAKRLNKGNEWFFDEKHDKMNGKIEQI